MLGYEDVFAAADAVPRILEFGPIGLEGFDDKLVADMRRKHLHEDGVALLPDGSGWLLVEFGADSLDAARAAAARMVDALRAGSGAPSVRVMEDPKMAKKVWQVRESALGATAVVPGQPHAWEGWEDAAVRPDRLGRYLRELTGLFDQYGYRGNLYGHFGDGCVHTRIDFDLESAEGIEKFRAFVHDAAHLVVRHGGSLSGEHGDGQARAELLPIMFGEEMMHAFQEFKAIWDPEWKMNPGKVVDPYRVDENLRLGPDYDPWDPPTRFAFPEDEGSLAWATQRCVGVGACRKLDSGTMCPSYRATREEMHSTRGRARLFWEMLQGEVVSDGWQSEEVKEALDLCFSCKACKSECPVHVDMATWKAEFLSHYYERRRRPAAAYAMGWIRRWSTLASFAPRLANLALHAPGVSALMKRILGIAPERELPRFSAVPFRKSFQSGREDPDRPTVILWTDTFNDRFHSATAGAAAEVLTAAGWNVTLPPRGLCCGRPLYDFGFLDQARRQLLQILVAMSESIERGTPIVVLEPSCAAVFHDELLAFFPRDDRAQKLSKQVFTLAAFLEQHAAGWTLPLLPRKATVHGHCHQKALLGMDAEMRVLGKMGIDATLLDSGCCGMAGAFGFEQEHYDVSVAAGERVLLPAVRAAGPDELVITDGFSCREQIRQLGGRDAMHLAEVIHLALRESGERN